MRTNIILLITLIGAVAAVQLTPPTLRECSEQSNVNNLAQTGDDGEGEGEGWEGCGIPECVGDIHLEKLDCDCKFSAVPGLGSGQSQGFQQFAEARQVQSLSATPDT